MKNVSREIDTLIKCEKKMLEIKRKPTVFAGFLLRAGFGLRLDYLPNRPLSQPGTPSVSASATSS